jgi:hypothetical protein
LLVDFSRKIGGNFALSQHSRPQQEARDDAQQEKATSQQTYRVTVFLCDAFQIWGNHVKAKLL